MKKILAINGSPRKGKTTEFGLRHALEGSASVGPGVQTELIELGGLDIRHCIGCGKCSRKALECSQQDDFIELIPKLADPEVGGVIIGTPVYMGTMTSLCKSFLDRAVMLRRAGFRWSNLVGGVLAVGECRNGGQEMTIQAVHAALLVQDMIIVGDGPPEGQYGATLVSGIDGGVQQDEVGIASARSLGRRVAELVIRLAAAVP